METIFFESWSSLLRTVTIGMLAYASLIVLLRVSGKRTLSKMNAFDFVVTVALGSTLATILLNKDVTLAQGVVAFGLLIGMQFIVTWSSVHAGWVRKVVSGEPSLLLYRGATLPVAMLKSRVTEDELRAAVRDSGFPAFGNVQAVVLETDGSFSIVGGDMPAGKPSLDDLGLTGKKLEPGESSSSGE